MLKSDTIIRETILKTNGEFHEEMIRSKREYETCTEDSERRQVLAQVAQSFLGTIEFYKSELGGARSHDDAVKEALKNHEWRRGHFEAEEQLLLPIWSVSSVSPDLQENCL